jgi:hypothetical protein
VCVCVCVWRGDAGVGTCARVCAFACVAFLIQNGIIKFNIVCGLSVTSLYYSLSHKLHYFRKEVTENKVCVLIFFTNLI